MADPLQEILAALRVRVATLERLWLESIELMPPGDAAHWAGRYQEIMVEEEARHERVAGQ